MMNSGETIAFLNKGNRNLINNLLGATSWETLVCWSPLRRLATHRALDPSGLCGRVRTPCLGSPPAAGGALLRRDPGRNTASGPGASHSWLSLNLISEIDWNCPSNVFPGKDFKLSWFEAGSYGEDLFLFAAITTYDEPITDRIQTGCLLTEEMEPTGGDDGERAGLCREGANGDPRLSSHQHPLEDMDLLHPVPAQPSPLVQRACLLWISEAFSGSYTGILTGKLCTYSKGRFQHCFKCLFFVLNFNKNTKTACTCVQGAM